MAMQALRASRGLAGLLAGRSLPLLRAGAPAASSSGLRGMAMEAAAEQPAKDWWRDEALDSTTFYKRMVQQINGGHSFPGFGALVHFLDTRVSTPEDAYRAMGLVKLYRGYYVRFGRLDPLPMKVSALFLKSVVGAGALDIAREGLKGQAALGLAPGQKTFHFLMEKFAEEGDSAGLLYAYDALLAVGHRPDEETAKLMVEGLLKAGAEGPATTLLEELAVNDVAVSDDVKGAVTRVAEAKVAEAAAVAAAEAAAAAAAAAAAEAEVAAATAAAAAAEGEAAEGGEAGAATEGGEEKKE